MLELMDHLVGGWFFFLGNMLYWLYLTVKLLKDTPEIKAPVYSGRLTESQLYMNTPPCRNKRHLMVSISEWFH